MQKQVCINEEMQDTRHPPPTHWPHPSPNQTPTHQLQQLTSKATCKHKAPGSVPRELPQEVAVEPLVQELQLLQDIIDGGTHTKLQDWSQPVFHITLQIQAGVCILLHLHQTDCAITGDLDQRKRNNVQM